MSPRALLLAALLGVAGGEAAFAAPQFCGRTQPLTAPQQDRLLRFSAIARAELEASGRTVALVARSGLALDRFGLRYSHAGVSLRASANAPWSVRQLYYACDEARPRLYDQGLAGFLSDTDDPAVGYLSIVLLPPDAAGPLEAAALDAARALRLLAARYSANAYPFSVRYQNCNQWVMELLASAWGALPDGEDLRARAQRWLLASGYTPTVIEGTHLLMWISDFIPRLHADDHPPEDRSALRYRLSMPASIEAFVHARLPEAERIELCHTERQVVVRRGWEPIADGCRPGASDRVVALD